MKKDNQYRVVTITGGLGSQMAKYAFYLLVKKKSPNTVNLIDTYFFQFSNAWSGYELEKLFHISAPNIVDYYDPEEPIIDDYFQKAKDYFLKKQPSTQIIRVSRGEYTYYNHKLARARKFRDKVLFKIRYEYLMHFDEESKKYGYFHDRYKKNWYRLNANVYYDEFNFTSDIYFREIKDEIVETFTFPEFIDENNKKYSEEMMKQESVAIHVRRSDHMYDNGFLYENHYYEKSVNCIKSKVNNPVFYVFSDEADWCKNHKEELGLSEKDQIIYVDWNRNLDSYRDMQLMTYAKHNVLAISSFSWWGYYLSKHKEKIACAPKGYWFDIENHF